MKVKIEKSSIQGSIVAPPSKSMTHRLLICAGLARGTSVIHNVAPSEDILATMDCLNAIGAKIEYQGDSVKIEGANIKNIDNSLRLHCRESGSTLRFFIPICSVLARKADFTGSERLLSRPLSCYETIFKEQNIEFTNDGNSIHLDGRLSAGKYKIKGNISSQFISGLLFALPLLSEDSTINIIPPIESCSYIDLTISALSQFGVNVSWADERTLFIKGGQSYAPMEVFVEGDYSNAAFFEALNYLGGKVSIDGLSKDSIQGDKAYKEFFPMLEKGTPTIHLGGCPDLGSILFALAAAKNGAIFTGTRRLKLKESDRSAAMSQELRKMGVSVKIEDDSVLVYPINLDAPNSVLNGHNDHRIVMSLAVLLTQTGGTIEGAEAVSKSMPDFFEKLKNLGADIEIEDNTHS